MRGYYKATIKISALAASRTILYITAPATKAVEIVRAWIGNSSNVTNQQNEIQIKNITTLGTPTATAITPTPDEGGDQAAGSTVKGNVTASEPTYGTTIIDDGFASLPGWNYEPQPDDRIYVTPATSIGIFLNTVPTSMDTIVGLSFREIG